MQLPHISILLLILAEACTPFQEEPILPIDAGMIALVPVARAQFWDLKTKHEFYIYSSSAELLKMNKIIRVYTLFRAFFTLDTYTVFQYTIPFSKPRVRTLNITNRKIL